MRTPVVKRQPTPRSGFCSFFPLVVRLSVMRLWPQVRGTGPAGLLRVPCRRDRRRTEPATPAAPGVVQCGVRRRRCAPCAVETRARSARGVALAHGRDGPPAWLAQAGPGWARPVVFLQGGQGLVAGGMGPQQKPGGCREGPRARGGAARRARGPVALPRRRRRARDEAARREALVAPRAAGALLACRA